MRYLEAGKLDKVRACISDVRADCPDYIEHVAATEALALADAVEALLGPPQTGTRRGLTELHYRDHAVYTTLERGVEILLGEYDLGGPGEGFRFVPSLTLLEMGEREQKAVDAFADANLESAVADLVAATRRVKP